MRSLLALLTLVGSCSCPAPAPTPVPISARVHPPGPTVRQLPFMDDCLTVIPDVATFGEAGDAFFAQWVTEFVTVDYLGSATGWWIDETGRYIGWSAQEDAPLCVLVWSGATP